MLRNVRRPCRQKAGIPGWWGSFLRNEPAWAFVDNLVIADEVLYNPVRTVCKERLVESLKAEYQTIEALNGAWNSSFEEFEDLYESQAHVSQWSERAGRDMHAFPGR